MLIVLLCPLVLMGYTLYIERAGTTSRGGVLYNKITQQNPITNSDPEIETELRGEKWSLVFCGDIRRRLQSSLTCWIKQFSY